MNDEQKDRIIQLYLRTKALKNNLPSGSINERYVTEYSTIIGSFIPLLKDANLSDFQIEDNDLEKHLLSYNPLTGEKNYSSDRYVERGLFLLKVEAFCEYIKNKFREFLSDL